MKEDYEKMKIALRYFLLGKGYYKSVNDQKYEILSEYFKELFLFNKVKTPIELESYIEIYKIFDQNLKKTN